MNWQLNLSPNSLVHYYSIWLIESTIIQFDQVGASLTWSGFANPADRNRPESFLRWSERFEYREPASKTLSEICELADEKHHEQRESSALPAPPTEAQSTLYSTSAIAPVPTYSSHYRCKWK